MKAVLVTSQVTYVPSNYLGLLEELLPRAREHIDSLVLLENWELKLAMQAAGLFFLGCPGLGTQLLRNIASLPLDPRIALCKKHGVPVFRLGSMNGDKARELLRARNADLVINARTRCIYKSETLETPRLGCINIHHGLLPEYRGTFCDLYALSEKRSAGFTIHQMTEKVDAGRILRRQPVSKAGEKNYVSYLAQAARSEGGVLAELLREIAEKGALPEGKPNTCEKPIYTRNPNRSRIAEMRRGGLRL